MEPLTAGTICLQHAVRLGAGYANAIALATLLLNKTFEKTGEIVVAKAFEKAKR